MEYIGYGIAIICIVILIIFKKEEKKKYTELEKSEILNNSEEYKRTRAQVNAEKLKLENISRQKQLSEDEIHRIEREINEKKSFNSTLLQLREEELNSIINEKREKEESKLSIEIKDWAQSAQEAANFNSKINISLLKSIEDQKRIELQELKDEVEDFRIKRDAINQEILRSRAIEENQDFYRIQVPENYRRDIEVLNSIRPSISKVDILDKLIYDNYIKKSVDEMIKRVLKGENPSGIYKITRLKTGEVYVGKSVNLRDRWIQHSKSAFHCGTISHSTLHTTMEKDGIWNFTFEVLEEVPKEKLTEREKYYINFYDSKKYGLNEREG